MKLPMLSPYLLLAIGSTTVAAASQTYYPSQIIQLDRSGGGGLTTSPNIQNKSNVFSLEVAFKLPEVPSTAKCTLGFQVTGKNSESDWVAFVPDGSAEIIVSAFTTPMDPSKDTYYHHAKVGDVVNSIKISTTLAGGLNAAFSPSIVPCSSASGLLFEPGASTMILSWEQIGDKPDGVQIVVDDAN